MKEPPEEAPNSDASATRRFVGPVDEGVFVGVGDAVGDGVAVGVGVTLGVGEALPDANALAEGRMLGATERVGAAGEAVPGAVAPPLTEGGAVAPPRPEGGAVALSNAVLLLTADAAALKEALVEEEVLLSALPRAERDAEGLPLSLRRKLPAEV